jgi:hypothetical protein
LNGEWRTLERFGIVEGSALLQKKPVAPLPPVTPPANPPAAAPDYTWAIIGGFALIVLAILVAAVVIRKKPTAETKK